MFQIRKNGGERKDTVAVNLTYQVSHGIVMKGSRFPLPVFGLFRHPGKFPRMLFCLIA